MRSNKNNNLLHFEYGDIYNFSDINTLISQKLFLEVGDKYLQTTALILFSFVLTEAFWICGK